MATDRPLIGPDANRRPPDSGPACDTPAQAIAAIRANLEHDDPAVASTLLERALALWPNDTSLILTRGDVLLKTAGRDAAAAYYADLLSTGTALPWPAGRLLTIAGAGPLETQVTLKSAMACASAEIDLKVKQALLHELITKSDPSERLGLLEKVAPASGLLRFELRLAAAYAEKGNPEAALKVLERAAEEGRSTPQAALLRAELLSVDGRPEDGIAVLEAVRAENPEYTEVYRRLILFHQRERHFDRAADLMEEIIQRSPVDWMLLHRLNRLSIGRDRLAAIFNRIRAASHPVSEKDARFRYQFALACLDAGDVDEGFRLLEQPFDEPVASMVRPVLTALHSRPRERWVSESRLSDNRILEVQVTRARRRARASVVIPAGALFGNLPLSFLDALLAPHDVNVVYLRDFQKRAFLRGVSALGADEPETVSALRRLVAELGAPRTLVMGSSSGGFSALRYGALLEADDAVSFAGPSKVASFFDSTSASAWNPSFLVHLHLQQHKDLPYDLVPLLSQPCRTRFHQYYGTKNADDVGQAQRLMGLPNVLLKPVMDIADHLVVDHMIGSGAFDALVEDLAGPR